MAFRWMCRIRSLVALVLLALWMPATLHCELEWVGAFSDCSSCHEQAGNGDVARDCDADACAVIEKSAYRFGADVLLLKPPELIGWIFLSAIVLPEPDAIVARRLDATAAPPEVIRTWHFVTRAASPPRAPGRFS